MKFTVSCGNEKCAGHGQQKDYQPAEVVPGVYAVLDLRCSTCHQQVTVAEVNQQQGAGVKP